MPGPYGKGSAWSPSGAEKYRPLLRFKLKSGFSIYSACRGPHLTRGHWQRAPIARAGWRNTLRNTVGLRRRALGIHCRIASHCMCNRKPCANCVRAAFCPFLDAGHPSPAKTEPMPRVRAEAPEWAYPHSPSVRSRNGVRVALDADRFSQNAQRPAPQVRSRVAQYRHQLRQLGMPSRGSRTRII